MSIFSESRPCFRTPLLSVACRAARARMAFLILAGLLVGNVLTGCGGGTSNLTGIPNADGRALPAASTIHALQLSIASDKTTYKVGETIHLTISVTNTDSVAHTFAFPTPVKSTWWGYIISKNNTIVTYEYWPGHNLVLPSVVGTDTYAAGETHTFTYDFPFVPSTSSPPKVASLPVGIYQIYARYPNALYDGVDLVANSVPTPASAPITITVTP